MLFVKGVGGCQVSYADKKGKYQDQKGLTLPFVSNGAKMRLPRNARPNRRSDEVLHSYAQQHSF